MKPPPGLLGSALAFWGWHSGLWWLGLSLGALAEMPRWLSWHWESSLRERQRAADLSTLLMVLAGLYLYLTQPRLGDAIIVLLRWLPLWLFPLMAAQLFGGRDGVEASVLFISLRGRPEEGKPIDLRPAYLLLCLLAAGMVKPGSQAYFPGLAVLGAWSLWSLRPRPRSPVAWSGALILALGLGYFVGLSLQQMQLLLEDRVVEWLADWHGPEDPYRATTAIGEVGRLKLSERIVLRVRTDQPLQSPLLLRSASFNRYVHGTWLAHQYPFRSLGRDSNIWRITPGNEPSRWASVDMELDDGQGVLPLPADVRYLEGLEGAQLGRHPFGTVKVMEGPQLAGYRAYYADSAGDGPPEAADLRVPPIEQAFIEQLAQELGLTELSPLQTLDRLQAWFEEEFRYSLRLDGPDHGKDALEHFLLRSRQGHCEYFASAAVMLLRQAGIAARYARGWSVQEYSPLEQAYVARARHAHAWVLAWVDGTWRDFDPTPPDWGALEAENRPWWGPAQDLLSRLNFLWARRAPGKELDQTLLAWLLLPLAALLAWRMARRRRRKTRKTPAATAYAADISPFHPVQTALARHGLHRRNGETLREWVQRLEGQDQPLGAQLRPAVELYYRERFGPKGLEPREVSQMRGILNEILRAYR